ncbi:MAG TPA: JAB domain-containing protein [Bacteroidia bacterium]|nr:JAB domain-containing protein [Bacteroidia bacterium]
MQVRLSKEQKTRIANSQDVYAIMLAVLMRQNRLHRQKEYFWCMGLNSAHDILYLELVTIGVLNQSIVDPVELFSFAVQKKCKRVILIHNHPSGNLSPSAEDINLTNFLKTGGSYLKIEIIDHLIISETGYLSMAEHKLL